MIAFVAGTAFVLLLDQVVTQVTIRWLGRRAIALGPLGWIRLVPSTIWLARWKQLSGRSTMWGCWSVAAVALATVSIQAPALGWTAGLLIGGSLSHAVDTWRTGRVVDYICLPFWPAFNLADVAIAGGCGWLIVQLALMFHRTTG